MIKQIVLLNILGIFVRFGAFAQSPAEAAPPSDSEIRAILADRVDNQRQSLGIVVGIIQPAGRRVIAYGNSGNDNHPLDGNTIFEIGGITKVFTALLLADMAQHHAVALTDPIAKYLPRNVKIQERSGRITLQDLATHTSGLPRSPTNLVAKDSQNPYASYTAEQLYGFLASYQLPHDRSSDAEYSNVAYGLLGQILSSRAHKSYEAMVRSSITAPLKMNSTGITLSSEMKARLAIGHDRQLSEVPNWDFQALAGAGALRSTANDLLTFLAAEMGNSQSPLAPAMEDMLKVRRPTATKGLENALGWQISTLNANEIVQKDGITISGGYSTFIAYVPKTRTGVVVLSNALTPTGVSDIALHLLNPVYPLRGTRQKEVTVNPKLLEKYVGDYQLSPTATVKITRQDNALFAQVTGQPKLQVFPQSDRNFFYKVFDAQLTFETDDQGRATALVLLYNGVSSRAKRIEKP